VACGNTHERDDRAGVQAGHKKAELDVGSGAVERPGRFEHRDQRVAQALRRDALSYSHGAGTDGAWWLVVSSHGRIEAWFCAEERAATLEHQSLGSIRYEKASPKRLAFLMSTSRFLTRLQRIDH
jgi:hypothetical protein